MQTKIRLGILFGGESEEHEISMRSVDSIFKHLQPDKYEVIPIKIEKNGSWVCNEINDFSPFRLKEMLDVIFPVLHGPHGEDGTIQGFLELAHIPYVGSNHLSSAMCMDKGIMKERWRGENLPIPYFEIYHFSELVDETILFETFSFPFFVKPIGLGSSVGINKVHAEEELQSALNEGFQYGERVIIEEGVEGRELEISVLGNLEPKASLPGEVIPTYEFFSYEAKHQGHHGADFIVPAKLSPAKIDEMQKLAIEAFKVMRCEGMARVDFFLDSNEKLLLNEINTIPGFTPSSLYPKLWEVSGLSYSDLLDTLIELAIERHSGIKVKDLFGVKSLDPLPSRFCDQSDKLNGNQSLF